MVQNINIQSAIDLREWLEANAGDQLVPWARLLAQRAALRVFPVVLTMGTVDHLLPHEKQSLVLRSLRSNIVSLLADTWPSDDINSAANLASLVVSEAAEFAGKAASPQATRALNAACFAAEAASHVAAIAAALPPEAAAIAGLAAARSVHAATPLTSSAALAVVPSIHADCQILMRSGRDALKNAPLWMRFDDTDDGNPVAATPPKEIIQWMDRLPLLTDILGPNAGLIDAWYQPLFAGQPPRFNDERARDFFIENISDDFWKITDERTGEDIMNDIAPGLGWKPVPSNAEILAAQKGNLGNKWFVGENHIIAASPVIDTDIAAATNPTTQKAFVSLNKKLSEFADIAAQFEELYGWAGFAEDYASLCEATNCEIADLADSIWDIYDRSLTLASYLQQDLDLRKANPSYSNAALSADHRRRLADIVRSFAPFVRRFPSIKEEDENTANYMHRVSESLAVKLLEGAGQREVITEKDRALMQALLTAMQRNGLPAEKAGTRGYFSVRNMLFVSAVFVTSTIAQGGIQKSDLYSRVTDWIGDHIDEAYEMITDESDDIKSVVQEMIAQIENDHNNEPPTLPDVGNLSGRRRRS